MEPIRVSRTAIETRQGCTKRRFLSTDYLGYGLTKKDSGYERLFGQIMHSALSEVLVHGDYRIKHLSDVMEAADRIYKDVELEQRQHIRGEQYWLMFFLVEGWKRYRYSTIKATYKVVSTEIEQSVILDPASYLPSPLAQQLRPLELPLRLDAMLEMNSTPNYYIMDFKSARQAGEDWNVNLDNSLQSDLYIEGAGLLYPDKYIGGIFYEGLVKGYRQVDGAKSSPYNGWLIQYGSPLYGWKAKDGKVYKDYVTGRQRCFIPNEMGSEDLFTYLTNLGWNIRQFFPSTIPYKPLDIGLTVGQAIVAENRYVADLEFYNNIEDSDEQKVYEALLFEQTKTQCFKYGSKHPCEFCMVCHDRISQDEITQQYNYREDHHTKEGDL